MTEDDVTSWIGGLAQGDQSAAQRIWERYSERLVQLARRHLRAANRRAADEEDVALSAFNSFCQRAAAGRFPQLDDRHDLWKLLVTITVRKAMALMRRAGRQKRGGGVVRGESALIRSDDFGAAGGINDVLGNEPTPEFVALFREECEQLLGSLQDEALQRVAVYKLEGYTNEEIAREMDCALRTVKRRLARIRQKWGARHGQGESIGSRPDKPLGANRGGLPAV